MGCRLRNAKTDITVRQKTPTGLQFTPDRSAIAINWAELPASDHFFLATHFDLKVTPIGLNMLFGTKSSFDETSQHFDLAVEIHMPIREAKTCLYQNVHIEIGGNGKTTFYDSLSVALKSYSPPERQKNIGLPPNRVSSFRVFPSNFAGIAFSGLQGMLEFFEIPPDALHHFRSGNPARPGAGVKPVIAIILDSVLLRSFTQECRSVLENESLGGSEK